MAKNNVQGKTKSNEKAVGGPVFHYFGKLPIEIQTKIITEALRKPQMHFARAVMKNTTSRWQMNIHPVTKSLDRSGFRFLNKLRFLSPAFAIAVRLATAENNSKLHFPVLSNNIDASTDIVCLHFEPLTGPYSFPAWHQDLWFLSTLRNHPLINTKLIRTHFAAIRRLALVYDKKYVEAESRRSFFRCYHTTYPSPHAEWRFCPHELAGFIECFPSLETFYILLDRGGFRKVHGSVKDYAQWFFDNGECLNCTNILL